MSTVDSFRSREIPIREQRLSICGRNSAVRLTWTEVVSCAEHSVECRIMVANHPGLPLGRTYILRV